MELPNYRMPGAKNVGHLLWDKAKDFLQRAFTVIFMATLVIWFLQTFDGHLNIVSDSQESILATVASVIAPVFAPMGFGDWRISTALITGFMAKESVVSTLEVLTIGCAIVWMYSFFDTFNLRAQIGAGTAPEDDYLVHINWKNQRMQEFMMDSHKLLGWGLIVLGALVAYQNILMNTLGDIVWRWGKNSPFFRALYLMMDQLPEIVVLSLIHI